MNLSRFREGSEAPAIPLTALIDVLFLLIIFLVLGASFDQIETVRLPEAKGLPLEENRTLQLVLRADGSLWFEQRPVSDADLWVLLQQKAPDAVLILPDEKAPVGALIGWYDRIRRKVKVPVQIGVRSPESPPHQGS